MKGLRWHFLQLPGVSPIFFLSGLRFGLEAILHEELKCIHLLDLMLPLSPSWMKSCKFFETE